MANFIPKRTIASRMPGVSDGNLVVAKDTGDLYIDVEDNGVVKRVKLSDVITGTYASIMSVLAPLTGKIYFATDTHELLQYSNGEWTVLNESGETEVVNNSNASVEVELQDNTIYNFTNANITRIRLTASESLSYCTICFTAGTSTIFEPPVGARCIGYNCSRGTFSPESGKEYQIAVDKLGNALNFYILRMDLEYAAS